MRIFFLSAGVLTLLILPARAAQRSAQSGRPQVRAAAAVMRPLPGPSLTLPAGPTLPQSAPPPLVPAALPPASVGATRQTLPIFLSATPPGVESVSGPNDSPRAEAGLPAADELGSRIREQARRQGLDDEKREGVLLPERGGVPDHTSVLGPAASAFTSEQPAREGGPPAPPDPVRVSARSFLVSILLTAMGGEVIYLAVVQLSHKLSGSFSVDSLLGMVSFAALTAGSLIAGPAIDRFGIRRTYLAVLAVRLAAGAALAALYIAGLIGLPGLIMLFALDFLAMGGTRVSESVMPTVLFSTSKSKINSFGNLQEMAVEAMGLFGLTAVGLLLPFFGYAGALVFYPALVLAAGVVTFAWLRVPTAASAPSAGTGIKERIAKVRAAIRANPLLRRAVIGYALTQIVYAFVYFIIIPNFGLFAARPGLPSGEAMLWASLFFASGGFLGTLLMAWLNKRNERRIAALALTARNAADYRGLLGSAAAWTAAGSVVLLGAWSLLLPAAGLGWLAFIFLLPFAVVLAGVYVNLESVIKTEVPREIRGSVMGVVRAGALLLASLSFPLLGLMFDHFSMSRDGVLVPQPGAFAVLAALLSAVAAAYFWISRGVGRR